MKTTKPFGHPDTLREGPHPCKGGCSSVENDRMIYHHEQRAWMKANKPLYCTGNLALDITHLPKELRSL